MRKLTLSIAAATLATTGLAGVAYAAPGMMSKGGDTTRAEAAAKADAMFAKMDVNGDGKIDQADRAAKKARMFDRMDADKSGSVSKEEFAAAGKKKGGPDGEMRGERRSKHGDRMGKRGHRGGGMAMMKMADTNKDGAISKAEFQTAALKRFDVADANKDGTVTAAERKAARDAMKAKWQQMRGQKQAQKPAAPATN